MGKNILITGVSGFVGKYFLEHLDTYECGYNVLGIDVVCPNETKDVFNNIEVHYKNINLLNIDDIKSILKLFRPDYILHLASYSSVAFSWQNPELSFRNNTNIFLNLIEAIRLNGINIRLLSVGSSEEYGKVEQDNLPLKETSPLNPISPYAVARVAQEMLAKIYVNNYDLDIVMTRSFNHIGPRQNEIFAISSFAKQMAMIKKMGNDMGTIVTGDVELIRDYVDVRDVVCAYYLLLKMGEKGEIYNICSERGQTIKNIIKIMSEIANLSIKIEVNRKLFRPDDNKVIIGSYEKIKKATSWNPSIPLNKTLEDVISYWEKKV